MSSQPATPKATIDPYAWIALSAVYLASLVCAYTFLAVPPLMPAIIGKYNIDLSHAGLAMAVYSFVGLLLSLPGGWVLQKFGIKAVGVLAMLLVLVGCVFGATAATFPLFLLGRGLQGLGFTFIAMVGMTTAGLWFPPQKLSLALGVSGTCVAVGGFIAMATIPRILAVSGVAAVWWMCAALSAVGALLILAFVKTPPWFHAAARGTQNGGTPPSVGEGFANRNIWLMTIAYSLTYLPAAAMMTFYVVFLNKMRGASLETAGSISGLIMIGWLIGAPVGGAILTKLGNFKLALIIATIATAVLVSTGFIARGPVIPLWAFLLGVISLGYAQVVGMCAIPGIVKKPELIGVGTGIFFLGVNAAGIIGPPLLGGLVQHFGWVVSGYAMMPILFVSAFFAAVTKFTD